MIPFEETFRGNILDILYQSDKKLTPRAFIKKLQQGFGISSSRAKRIIHHLIDEQELCYHQVYGSTYIEKSFLKPVRVTDRFILSPPGKTLPEGHKHHTIIIETGISFGSGQHPTTRLCLEAIGHCFFDKKRLTISKPWAGADIGTGSGVLAFAMIKAGMSSCKAYDIDPVSVNEARKNAVANNMDRVIEIVQGCFSPQPETYALVCANLRYPTLERIMPKIRSSLVPGGAVVLSGVRIWEAGDVTEACLKNGLDTIWRKSEKEWSGMVCVRKAHRE